MRHCLSVRTVYPRTGARVWYDDQRRVHGQIHAGEELVDYAFMGNNPDAADNRLLRDAMVAEVPIIHFLGISPGRYTAIYPTFVADWSPVELRARLAFAMPIEKAIVSIGLPAAPERRYALRMVSRRLHQARSAKLCSPRMQNGAPSRDYLNRGCSMRPASSPMFMKSSGSRWCPTDYPYPRCITLPSTLT